MVGSCLSTVSTLAFLFYLSACCVYSLIIFVVWLILPHRLYKLASTTTGILLFNSMQKRKEKVYLEERLLYLVYDTSRYIPMLTLNVYVFLLSFFFPCFLSRFSMSRSRCTWLLSQYPCFFFLHTHQQKKVKNKLFYLYRGAGFGFMLRPRVHCMRSALRGQATCIFSQYSYVCSSVYIQQQLQRELLSLRS